MEARKNLGGKEGPGRTLKSVAPLYRFSQEVRRMGAILEHSNMMASWSSATGATSATMYYAMYVVVIRIELVLAHPRPMT